MVLFAATLVLTVIAWTSHRASGALRAEAERVRASHRQLAIARANVEALRAEVSRVSPRLPERSAH